MTYFAKVIRTITHLSRVAELELIRIRPWSYRILGKCFLAIPSTMTVHPGEIVEVSQRDSELQIIRKTNLKRSALIVSAISAVMICVSLIFAGPHLTQLIPLAWASVFLGKLYQLKRSTSSARTFRS